MIYDTQTIQQDGRPGEVESEKCGHAKIIGEGAGGVADKKTAPKDGRKCRQNQDASRSAVSAAWYQKNKERERARALAWYRKNRARASGNNTKWRRLNKTRIKANSSRWYQANQKFAVARSVEYAKKNRVKVRTRMTAWRAANKDRIGAQQKAYKKKNWDKIRAYGIEFSRARRSMLKSSTPDQRDAAKAKILELLSRIDSECEYCGNIFQTRKMHLDHILPVSRNGTHTAENICLACAKCNQEKYNKILFEEWIPPKHRTGAGGHRQFTEPEAEKVLAN